MRTLWDHNRYCSMLQKIVNPGFHLLAFHTSPCNDVKMSAKGDRSLRPRNLPSSKSARLPARSDRFLQNPPHTAPQLSALVWFAAACPSLRLVSSSAFPESQMVPPIIVGFSALWESPGSYARYLKPKDAFVAMMAGSSPKQHRRVVTLAHFRL